MNKVNFHDIFKANYLSYIENYKKQIQNILNNYDVVIFMARKAICFYESMVINKEIKTTECEVFSGRVLDYNVIKSLQGKKVAVVDDVVVKGKSLTKVLNELEKNAINAYVLVVACDSEFPTKIFESENFKMCNSYVTLEKQDIYAFAGMITEYIEASMCPFNIDQPIYEVFVEESKTIKEIFYHYYAVDISSGIQKKYGIKNKVIYFEFNKQSECNDGILNEIFKNTIFKIRFMMNRFNDIIAIPFVLLPKVSEKDLNELYGYIKNENTDSIVDKRFLYATNENKLKIVSYCLSEYLFETFSEMLGINYTKKVENDVFQFSKTTNSLYDKGQVYNNINLIDKLQSVLLNYSDFSFSEVIGKAYEFIISSENSKNLYKTNGDVITEKIITYENLEMYLSNEISDAKFMASCVIDIFIDRGMIVPTIVHTDSRIMRVYKLGEYSKLTRSQIEAFAAMLYQYQEMIGDELGKTEFEKLCVLFFNTAINRGHFTQQSDFEEDCYSICYSLFGPRVSKSNIAYDVGGDSVLITDFCKTDNGKNIVTYKDGRYIIHPVATTQNMTQFATTFAYQYSLVRKLFDDETKREVDEKSVTTWNMYVHTYTQYLTLKAIGNNKKSQYLSLCAELYQLSKLKETFNMADKIELDSLKWILRGINSGIWKYWCFKNDALRKTTEKICEKNMTVGVMMMIDPEPAADISDEWNSIIDDAGELLYRAAFFIKEIIKLKESPNNLKNDDTFFSGLQHINSSIFTKSSYYAMFKEIRHKIEADVAEQSKLTSFDNWITSEINRIKADAKQQLKRCDLILSENTLEYKLIKKVLVIYSKTGQFPPNISCGLDEYYPENIIQSKYCKVFGLSSEKSSVSDLTDLLNRIEEMNYQDALRYFVFDLGDNYAGNAIEQVIKGEHFINIINSTLEQFNKGKFPVVKELVLVGNNKQAQSFKHNNYKFQLRNGESEIFPGGNTPIEMMQGVLENVSSEKLNVNIYVIQNIDKVGGNEMNIKNYGEIHSVTENGDNAKNYIAEGNITNMEYIPSDFEIQLTKLMDIVEENDKKNIEQAITAVKDQDKNKFVTAIKKLGTHTLSIAENVLGSVLYEWLKQHGLI